MGTHPIFESDFDCLTVQMWWGVNNLLLISMDGFRWDYLDRAGRLSMRNIERFWHQGVRAQYTTNQFTTKTIPNHWTMVTGLYVESHGIIQNDFYSASTGEYFDYSIPQTWNETQSWWGGEPLWLTYQRQGGKTGCDYWIGSEVAGRQPTNYMIPPRPLNNASKPWTDRVDNVVSWLKQDDVNLGLLYIEEPDHTGHMFGPDSPEVDQKLEELDGLVKYLVDELAKAGLEETTNVIITSDHGMASLSEDYLIFLDPNGDNGLESLMDMEKSALQTMVGFIFPASDDVKDELYQKLKEIQASRYPDTLHVWLKDEIPEELHYTHNDRIPEILLYSEEHFHIFFNRSQYDNGPHLKGQHGWRPDVTDMHPIFMAKGPDFVRQRQPLEPFPNVDLYPLCCHLLQINPAPNNGSLTVVQKYLAQPMDLALPIAMGAVFAVFITGVIIYAIYSEFWKWRPQTLINDHSERTNIQYEGL